MAERKEDIDAADGAGAPAATDAPEAPEAASPSPEAEAEAEAMAAELAGEPPSPDDVIAALRAERDEMRDRMLRAMAEGENIRKRAERDRRDGETYGATRLARDLLAVHDNLERALASCDEETRARAAAFIEGVELTRRELINAFAKHRIEKIVPAVGDRFDPNRHQAMFEAPVPGAETGTVIEVMQAGFVIAERLLRPALVGVARAAPAEAKAEPPGEAPAAPPASEA